MLIEKFTVESATARTIEDGATGDRVRGERARVREHAGGAKDVDER